MSRLSRAFLWLLFRPGPWGNSDDAAESLKFRVVQRTTVRGVPENLQHFRALKAVLKRSEIDKARGQYDACPVAKPR